MRLTGSLLKVEDYSGDFRGDDGSNIAYSGQRLHILDGVEVVKVKVPKDLVNAHGLVSGDSVDLHVSVAANAGARGAYLTVLLLGDYSSVAA